MNRLIQTELDRGYVEKCAEYGITDEATISSLMDVSAQAINQERSQNMQKQASYRHQNSDLIEMQKQANLKEAELPIDAGFVSRCHEYGIVHKPEIAAMMKVASHLVSEEYGLGMEKSAALNQEDYVHLDNVANRLV